MTNFTSVKDYNAIGDGVTDDTLAIQAALDDSLYVYFPDGKYKTSAMLKVRNFQVIRGSGSETSLIYNNMTDCFGKSDVSREEGNFFQLSGIGCVKDFDPASRTVAFNLSNSSFIKCDDVAAAYFYKAVYLARDYTNFDGRGWCWYNVFHRVTATECHYGIHIDDSISNQSVNGCLFSQMVMSGWDYRWRAALPGTNTCGIRYSGYGHTFKDSYIQGFAHHIWRDQIGGNNLLEGLYLESEVVEGQAVYAPKRYFEHQDTWIGGHCDGFNLMESVLDPERVFHINTPAAIINSSSILGLEARYGLELIKNGNFVDGTQGWAANSAALSVVTNSGGDNYLRLSQSSTVTGYAHQVIRTTPGKRHKLTFKHKNGSFTGRVLVGRGVTGTEFGYIAVLSDIDWTEYILDFTPDTPTTYIVFACAGTSDDSFYGDISVTEMAISSIGDVHVEGNIDVSRSVKIKNLPVLGERQGAIADATPVTGTVTDVVFNDVVSKFNDLLRKLRTHGLISK